MPGEAEGPDQSAVDKLRRLVHDIVKDRLSGQVDRLLEHFAPDVMIYYNHVQDGLCGPSVWRGREALRQKLRRAEINYDLLDAEILDIVADAPGTAVRSRSVWRERATGVVSTLGMAHFLLWSEGKVVELHEFLDRQSDCAPLQPSDRTLEELISPPPPGLDRQEIERRAGLLLTCGPNIELVRELCAPEVISEFVGDRRRIPYAGRHVGVEALIGVIRAIAVDFEQSNYVVTELRVDGGKVAGRRSVEWRHYGTGRRGRVELAGFARFENGLVVELVEYRDSITLLEMQGDRD
jgi:ketosteroid isomerase-like protein